MSEVETRGSAADPTPGPADGALAGHEVPELLELVGVGQRLVGDSWKFSKELAAVAAAESKLSGLSAGVVAAALVLGLVCAVSLLFTLNLLLIYVVAQLFGQSWLLGILTACIVNLCGLVALGLYIRRVWSLIGFERTGTLVKSLFAAATATPEDGPATQGTGVGSSGVGRPAAGFSGPAASAPQTQDVPNT